MPIWSPEIEKKQNEWEREIVAENERLKELLDTVTQTAKNRLERIKELENENSKGYSSIQLVQSMRID